jgi:hypothetical protein
MLGLSMRNSATFCIKLCMIINMASRYVFHNGVEKGR